MQNSMRMKIGTWLRSLRKPMMDHHPVRFSVDGKGVQSLLIILPDQLEEYRVARHVFKSIQQEHPDISFHFIVPTAEFIEPAPSSGNGILLITEENLDRWHLPNQAFIDSVYSRNYDVVINLSARSNLVVDWIMRFAKSPIRIGYHSSNESHNYNLLIERKSRASLEKTYLHIQRILGL